MNDMFPFILATREAIRNFKTSWGESYIVIHAVSLELKTCSCLQFQDFNLPCCHAFSLSLKEKTDLYLLVSPSYTMAAYRSQYSVLMFSVLTADLQLELTCRATAHTVLHSRPPIKHKRLTHQGSCEGRNWYGKCRETGHNRWSCPNRPFTQKKISVFFSNYISGATGVIWMAPTVNKYHMGAF